MKKIIVATLIFFSSVNLNAQQVVALSNINLRTSGSSAAMSLLVVTKGTLLNLDDCKDAWCKVNYNGIAGFINSSFTGQKTNSSSNVSPDTKVKYYTNSAGNNIQSPTQYNKIPEGATAVCRDGTYSFRASRRGTCSQHGGVKKWF